MPCVVFHDRILAATLVIALLNPWLSLYPDSFDLRILYGRNSGEQTDERFFPGTLYGQKTGDTAAAGIGDRAISALLMGSGYAYENHYSRDYPYIGMEGVYGTGRTETIAILKYSGPDSASGGFARNDADACYYRCGPDGAQFDIRDGSLNDTPHRIHVTDLSRSYAESGRAYITELRSSIHFRYFPFPDGEDRSGIYFTAGLDRQETSYTVREKYVHRLDGGTLPGWSSFYSGAVLEFPVGLGYSVPLKSVSIDASFFLLTGRGSFTESTFAPGSSLYGEKTQTTSGYGAFYRIRLSRDFGGALSAGVGLYGRRYFSKGHETMRGGSRNDIIILNEISRITGSVRTPPIFGGVKEASLELFASRRFGGRN